ncbi:hypothetical protein LCGC14_1959870 [marine sediment metagenome]|uniref:CCA-adding enzyme C-terminal domain-containing protein n=1 Tax=marine sediment metagenome TaxID=412755 RepID=A0A0F9G399_9ZZZZ
MLRKRLPLVDRARIYDALEFMSIESVLLAMATSTSEDKKKEIASYLLDLRKVKPLLTGSDLKEMGIEPGPVYGEILSALRHERLRQSLQSRQEEERFVREFMKTR